MAERIAICSAKRDNKILGYIEGCEAFDLLGRRRADYNPNTGLLYDLLDGGVVGYVTFDSKFAGLSKSADEMFPKTHEVTPPQSPGDYVNNLSIGRCVRLASNSWMSAPRHRVPFQKRKARHQTKRLSLRSKYLQVTRARRPQSKSLSRILRVGLLRPSSLDTMGPRQLFQPASIKCQAALQLSKSLIWRAFSRGHSRYRAARL